LLGNCRIKEFNDSFRDYALNLNKIREKHEWMQAFPGDWNEVLSALFKNCMIKSSGNTEQRECRNTVLSVKQINNMQCQVQGRHDRKKTRIVGSGFFVYFTIIFSV